jgi:hypothetical protein
MKFQKYLTETYTNLTIEVLLENCRPICETYVKTKGVLYRGIKKIHNEERSMFMLRSRRKDRKPRNSATELHNLFDDVFNEIFHWKPRSSGIFCTTDYQTATFYGYSYIVFPVGKFRYIYGENVRDTIDLPGQVLKKMGHYNIKNWQDPTFVKELKEFVKENFTDKNLEGLLSKASDTEVILDCDEYYCLRRADIDYTKLMKDLKNAL